MPRRAAATPSARSGARSEAPRLPVAEPRARRPVTDDRPRAAALPHARGRLTRHELILTFHGIGEPPQPLSDGEARVWVPRDWFEAIADAASEPHVQLAFDDGNISDLQIALPALAARGIKARFFPLAGRIGAAGYLDAQDIAELGAAGMTIGSQGVHHRAWRSLTGAELRSELMESRQALAAATGCDVTEAACPFGSYDRRVLQALHGAGYSRVFTSDGGMCRTGSWLSARTTVSREEPLSHWLDLARPGGSRRPGPVALGKRLVKRLR